MSVVVQETQGKHSSKNCGQIPATCIVFGGIEYYLDQAPTEVISFPSSHPPEGLFSGFQGDFLPCTVINWSAEQFERADLNAAATKLALRDDVWTPVFLEGETSCRHEIAIMATNNVTPIDSLHTADTPNFKNICCAR